MAGIDHIDDVFHAPTAALASSLARHWAREGGLRLRTIVRCRRREDIRPTQDGEAWQVTLAVAVSA